MNFDIVLFLWLVYSSATGVTPTVTSCDGSAAKYMAIENRCYWCLGGANSSVGEKSCEENDGTVFEVQNIDQAMLVKDRLNISEATELFLGAIFNVVNGTQYYEWLSAPGTPSELLSNISALGRGNKSVACLSVVEEIKPVSCDKEMTATVCMRDITPDCPCVMPSTPSDVGTRGISLNAIQTTIDVASTTTSSPRTGETSYTAVDQIVNNITNASYKPTNKPKGADDVPAHTADTSEAVHSTSTTIVTRLGASNAIVTVNSNTTTMSDAQTSGTISPASVSTPDQTPPESSVTGDANMTAHGDDSFINNDHLDESDNTSTKLNLSEKIEHVPGINGSISVDELMDRVISNSRKISKASIETNTTLAPTTPVRYCKDGEDDFAKVSAHLGDIILVNGVNGSKALNFSNILDHVLDHKKDQTSKKPCIPIAYQGNDKGSSVNIKDQVKDVKFQVSPDLNNIPPWRGDYNLIPYGDDHPMIGILRNTSRDLDELQQTEDVTNSTFQRLSGTIEHVVTHSHMQHVSDQLKETLLSDIMTTAERLVTQVKSPCERLHIQTETLEVDSKLVKVEDSNDSYVAVKYTDKQTVHVSKALFDESVDTRVSTIEYKKLDAIITSSDSHVSSHVMSVSVQRVTGNTTANVAIKGTKDAVILVLETFLKPDKKEDTRLCAFWDFDTRNWSSFGCQLLEQNFTHTTCTCNHLTNFAVLVMYLDTQKISLHSQQVLLTLTTVGCSLSIACLAMTLIAFAYLRMLGNEKIMIHFNLSLALVLAQIVFVSSSDAHTNAIACKVVAILLHFFFMASFTWMLVEGLALYLLCTKGFISHRDMRIKYFLLGWGLPAVIVLISLAAKFPSYGHGPQYSCWLSVKDGLIWAFLGPMLAIVVLNMFVMGLVVRKFLTLKAVSQKTELAKIRGSLRAMMTLLPLLGLTWLLSLLVPFSVVFHYFFVIINTLQGMCIFFLHCICNDELRKKFQAKRRRWSSPTRTGSDSDTRYTSFDEGAVAATTSSSHAARKYAWTEQSVNNIAEDNCQGGRCSSTGNPLFY